MNSVAPTPQTHLVVLPLQAWGHARPLTGLVARIAQTGPLTITFFTPKHLYQRVKTELSRHFDGPRSFQRARIRVVALPADEENALDLCTFFDSFTNAYNKLVREESVTCVYTGVTMDAVRAPDAVILDIFAHSVTVKIRKMRHRAKVFCYTPCGAFATYRILYLALEQNEHQNLSSYRQRLERRAHSSGESLEDVAQDEFMSTRGDIIRPHGLPAMYDYENYPQEVRQTRLSPLYHLHIIEHMIECDGIITSGPACLEAPEGLSRLSAWLAQTSRSLYVVGPLQPVGNLEHAAAQEKTLSKDARKIDAFMERVLKLRGERSMIFMSFGSLFWPVDSSKVWAFVDVLLNKRIPFIFSHSAQHASVPESVTQRVRYSDLGFLTSWAPQQAVLAHSATGWFVTHAGFNSVMESVTAGVPMICWPFRAEQPTNTLHVTHNLDIAYELFEVRTGPDASRPIFTLGRAPRGTLDAVRTEACAVLGRAFGADGERKRANVQRMKADVLAAWAEGGSASEAVRSLVGAFQGR